MSFLSDQDFSPQQVPFQAASRFDAYFDVYGLSLKQDASEPQRVVTMIARSPASPIAQALAINLGRFEPGTVQAAIIFADIAPPHALDFMLQSISTACPKGPETIIRWTGNRALLEAHERLTLGTTLCWTGDSMRRTEQSRSVIDRVDDATPEILAEAHASFAALWRIAKPIPREALSYFSKETTEDEVMAGRFVRFEDYFSVRRH